MSNLINISEVVEFAIYIEQNGYKFYVEAIKKLKEKKLIDLFQYLADEEFRHEQTFKNLLKKTEGFTPHESYPGEYETYMKDFLKSHSLANKESFENKINEITSPESAIQIALEFEKDSIVLFSMLKRYIENENKHIVEAIIQEELNHLSKINHYRYSEEEA